MKDVRKKSQWRYKTQREMMRNNLRELGVQEFTLEGLLSIGERAQVRVLLAFIRDIAVFYRI